MIEIPLQRYLSPPQPAPANPWSAIREAIAIEELAEAASRRTDVVRVLDLGSGPGVLAARIIESLPDAAHRVGYVAIDSENDAINAIRTNENFRSKLCSVKAFRRDLPDLGGLSSSFDVIVSANCFHELLPRHFGEFFEHVNVLLAGRSSTFVLIDMESLPADAPEVNAVNWTREEVAVMLSAAGYRTQVSVHPRATRVFVARLKKIASVRVDSLQSMIRTLLVRKAIQANEAQKTALRSGEASPDALLERVVRLGTSARLLEELVDMGIVTERSRRMNRQVRAELAHRAAQKNGYLAAKYPRRART